MFVFVFDLGDSGLEYKAGDALGVIPICRPDLVEEILVQCNFTGEEVVDTHLGECTLKEALSTRYEIHRLSKKWIMGLGEHFNNSSEEVEIKIIKRKRISEENGIVIAISVFLIILKIFTSSKINNLFLSFILFGIKFFKFLNELVNTILYFINIFKFR